MRQFIICMLALLFVVSSVDTMAKGSRGGGRSSSKSSFKSPSKTKVRKAPAKVKKVDKKVVQPGKAKSKSSFKKADKTKAPKPKAVSKNKMDRKQTRAMKTKNTAAAKKYGNKKNAAKAYKNKMAKSNSYNSSTPPKTRPGHIPQTVVIAGHPAVSVGYYPFGGMYGYGYMDPITRMYVACAASQMIANDMAMQQAGYGQWQSNGRPVRQSNPLSVLFFFIGAAIFVVVVVIVIKKCS